MIMMILPPVMWVATVKIHARYVCEIVSGIDLYACCCEIKSFLPRLQRVQLDDRSSRRMFYNDTGNLDDGIAMNHGGVGHCKVKICRLDGACLYAAALLNLTSAMAAHSLLLFHRSM